MCLKVNEVTEGLSAGGNLEYGSAGDSSFLQILPGKQVRKKP